MTAWQRWFEEACAALDEAITAQAKLWLRERTMSEAYREAVERTMRARQRFDERLTAYNAYREGNPPNGA
jgi:hypothetical protein